MNNNRNEVGMKRVLHVLTSPRWITLMFVLPLLAVAHFALAQTTDPATVKFDHVQTGFNLTGSHAQARCGSCHLQGVFKGTPRDCASCHITGNRMGAMAKPDKHISTTAKCDSCHKTTVWTDATFSHVGLAPGSCLTCHNGTTATGKSSGHVPSTGSCDNCHKTISWQQAVFSHTGIVSGCASCHNHQTFNGVTPVSQPSNHISTIAPCETCHNSTSTFTSATGTPLPPNHLPTTQSCGICHNMAGFVPGIMNHLGIFGGCASCHNGQSFLGVTPKSKLDAPTTHMTTALDCSSCHTSTTTFLMANLTTTPAGHLPTTQLCSTCHISGFGPGSGVMSHTGIGSGCASCHSGQSFTGVMPVSKPGTHLPTSAACETCHSPSAFTTFSGTTMNHLGIVNNCIACHNGQTFAVGMTPKRKQDAPTTHMTTALDCSSCHTSTITFTGASPTVLPANHLPTTQTCAICHTSYGPGSGVMNHVGIVNNCIACHNGQTFAVGMTPKRKQDAPTTHLTTALDCSSCHSSTTTFVGASGGTLPANHLPTTQPCSTCHASFGSGSGVMNHTGILSGCASCHNGQSFVGVTPKYKPSNHLATSLACETCHSATRFTTFSGTAMIHTGILSGCASCHNGQAFAGVTPVSKPVNHFPTSLACETCHSATRFTTFSGTAMSHTGIVNNCTLCHNGQVFAGVTPVSKPSNHIPYAANLTGGASMACEFCHTPTVFTSFTALVSSTTMHNGTLGNGSGSCKACHLTGTSYLGSMRRNSLNHEGTGTDCSQSGCHRPLGSKGSSYTNWN